jgi:hypothetical protein
VDSTPGKVAASKPRIVGIGGRAGAGKDTFAESLLSFLAPYCVAIDFHFASLLKSLAHALFDWAGLRSEAYYDEHRDEREKILERIGLTPRQVWQKFGMAMRDIYPDVWVRSLADLLERDDGLDIIVIPDVRFSNEMEWIKAQGGWLLYIDSPEGQPGIIDESIHKCEFPTVIMNDGALWKLEAEAVSVGRFLLEQLKGDVKR